MAKKTPSPFTVYVPNIVTLVKMREYSDDTAEALEFGSRNEYLIWLLTQPPEDLAKALCPLRAKDLQKQANKYRQ